MAERFAAGLADVIGNAANVNFEMLRIRLSQLREVDRLDQLLMNRCLELLEAMLKGFDVGSQFARLFKGAVFVVGDMAFTRRNG